MPVHEILLGGVRFRVELAVSDAEKSRGLMHRESLRADHGMLFLFRPAAPVRFWMKNVELALDILFFDRNGCMLDHHDRAPPCTTADCAFYTTDRATSWVLEVPAGTRVGLGIEIGECALELSEAVQRLASPLGEATRAEN